MQQATIEGIVLNSINISYHYDSSNRCNFDVDFRIFF